VADDSDQRDLILILARDLTSRLATAAFVVDAVPGSAGHEDGMDHGDH